MSKEGKLFYMIKCREMIIGWQLVIFGIHFALKGFNLIKEYQTTEYGSALIDSFAYL